jgi:hypothetical protein
MTLFFPKQTNRASEAAKNINLNISLKVNEAKGSLKGIAAFAHSISGHGRKDSEMSLTSN